MKSLHFLFALACLVTSSLSAQDVLQIRFGELYGNDHSTTSQTEVISGTGSVGTALEGNTLYWVCLDLGTTEPTAGAVATYTLLDSATGLDGGLWGSDITDEASMNSIGRAVSNMFSFYKDDLLTSLNGNGSNNTAGTAFQTATWYLTEAYSANVWSGTINQQAIDNLIAWNGGGYLMAAQTPANTWLRDMLQATIIDAPQQQVFFANPNAAGGSQWRFYHLILFLYLSLAVQPWLGSVV